MYKFIATNNDEGRTILKFLFSMFLDVPKSRIEKLFRNKEIKINGKRIKDKKTILKINDSIEVYGIKSDFKLNNKKIKVEFKVIFEDENILIINKPENIIVHGEENSINNQVNSYLNFKKIDSFIPSNIGRLDKVASGIMVYAKNYKSLRELENNKNNFIKIYKVKSNLKEKITLESKIFHNEEKQKEEISLKFGKNCKTIFNPLENEIVEVQIITGRKHQIRASLEYLNHPIKGDLKYNGEKANRVHLHSYKIIFKNLENDLKYLNEKEFISEPNFVF